MTLDAIASPVRLKAVVGPRQPDPTPELEQLYRGFERELLTRREVGSSVYQVFDGSGTVMVGESEWMVGRGDMFVVPSWAPFTVRAAGATHLDLFRFSDAPIFEALHAHRVQIDGQSPG